MLKQAHDCFRDCVIYYESTELQMELAKLAIAVDVGNVFFFKATYSLEGEVPLALSTYEHILTLLFFNYSVLSQYYCNLHITAWW